MTMEKQVEFATTWARKQIQTYDVRIDQSGRDDIAAAILCLVAENTEARDSLRNILTHIKTLPEPSLGRKPGPYYRDEMISRINEVLQDG